MNIAVNPYSFHQLLEGTLLAQGACTLAYVISVLFVASNAYDGFNAVMLGLVYAIAVLATYRVTKTDISRIVYGVILGVSCMLAVISLQSAIFWGQYSGCESSSVATSSTTTPSMSPTASPSSRRLSADLSFPASRRLTIGVVCSNNAAMRSICAFSVFLFLSYLFLTALMIRYKNDLLKATATRQGYTAVPPALAQPAVSSKVPSSYAPRGGSQLPESVDV